MSSNNNDSGIRWEAPPRPPRTGNRDWFAIIAALKERPGEWALVADGASASVAQILKKGGLGGASRGEVEARAVTAGMEKGAKIYARWVGGDSE